MQISTWTIVPVMLLLAHCDNPTRNKPKAEVSSATPIATAQAPSENGETLPISTTGSSVSFVASKVTRSHNGRFTRFSGQAALSGGKPEGGKVSLDIDMPSVETDTE